MKLAREHDVPVVMQGQGGDELFWGYPLLKQAALESKQKQANGRRSFAAFAQHMSLVAPSEISYEGVASWVRNLCGIRSDWLRFQKHRGDPQDQMVFYDLSPDFRMALSEAPNLYGSRFAEQLDDSSPSAGFTFKQPWPEVDVTLTRLICATYLRENGITQGDRLSMASSIEMRLPLLDYRLIETVIGLRKTRSDVNLRPKAWLKDSLKDTLPELILNRAKRGFAPPIREWHDAIFAAYGHSLADGYLVQTGILNNESGKLLAPGPFPAGATSPLSFKALVLEQWCRQMLTCC
jgi:asparagine synthase (glutamine-hydrolysing)